MRIDISSSMKVMMGRAALAAVAALLVLLVVADGKSYPSPPPPTTTLTKNGVRMVGASWLSSTIVRGRLEVSSKDAWVNGYEMGKVAWRPLCDSSFGDNLAKDMCTLLGYKFGRMYYSPSVTYRPADANATGSPLGQLSCSKASRRSLRAGSEGAAASVALADPEGGRRGHSRSLSSLLSGSVNIPAKAKMQCDFSQGACAYTGPLAGLECSDKRLPPAPSPPPSPPNPPPAPPLKSHSIRVIGGFDFAPTTTVEPNLCPNGTTTASGRKCTYFGRVEVQVAGPGGSKVWAPLCAAAPGSALEAELAKMVCYQAFDWDPAVDSPHGVVGAEPAERPFTIPIGKVFPTGSFVPAAYTRWATVTSASVGAATKVQDLKLKVSASQCASGAMFGVHCSIAVARRN